MKSSATAPTLEISGLARVAMLRRHDVPLLAQYG